MIRAGLLSFVPRRTAVTFNGWLGQHLPSLSHFDQSHHESAKPHTAHTLLVQCALHESLPNSTACFLCRPYHTPPPPALLSTSLLSGPSM